MMMVEIGRHTSDFYQDLFSLVNNVTSKSLYSFQVCELSRSVMSDSLRPRTVAPPGSPVHRDSLGKNTGVGCLARLQGIFPT